MDLLWYTLVVVTTAAFTMVVVLMVMYCCRKIKEDKERARRLAELIEMEDGSLEAPSDLAGEIDIAPDYWVSSEGVIHNSLCRWFEKCDGTVWDGTTESKDCGLCGGMNPIVRLWNIPEWKEAHKKEE